MSEIKTVTVTIQNRLGLHARPAMMLMEIAQNYESNIQVSKKSEPEEVFDGKSIMQMLMLAATRGTKIVITADGADADEALSELAKLIERGFDED